MTEEEIRSAEKYIRERYPIQYSALQRLLYRLDREWRGLWNVRTNYNDNKCTVIVTDAYKASVRTRVEEDGTYTVMVYDDFFRVDITVEQEAAAMQIMRLELEHMRHTMPHLYKKEEN